MSNSAAGIFRRINDAVYWTGAVIACVALVLVSAVIPWAVYTRYVLNSASSWPEPMAVLLTVAITFIGSANCYRQRIHMNMTVGTDIVTSIDKQPFRDAVKPVWEKYGAKYAEMTKRIAAVA